MAGEWGRLVERIEERAAWRALRRHVVLDRPTLVMGSAPNARLPDGWDPANPLVTVNAAQVSAAALGLGPPLLTVLSVTLLGTHANGREAQRVLAGLSTRHLLVISHAAEWQRDAPVLARIGYRAEQTHRVTTRWRSRIVLEQTGLDAGRGDPEHTKVSNGVYAICQTLALGAPHVVVAGFSLTGGHAYNELGLRRLHVEPDRRAFEALAQRAAGRIHAATEDVGAALGLPVWRAPS